MKKTLLGLLGVALFASCAENKSEDLNLHITGDIKGLKQGKLIIQKLKDTSFIVVDTIVFNGKSNFELSMNLDSPEMIYLFLDRGQTNSIDNNLMVFAEPGNLTINTTLERFFADAKITGSKNQELFEQYKNITANFTSQQLTLIQKEIYAKKANNTVLIDSITKAKESVLKRKYLYAINFALTQKNYEISPYIALAEVYDVRTKFLDTIHKSMTPKVAQSKYGKMLTKFVDSRKKEEANLLPEQQ